MGYIPAHSEGDSWLPPQGGLQIYCAASKYQNVWYMGLPTNGEGGGVCVGGGGGVGGVRGGPTGGGYLCRLLLEHGCTMNYDQAQYGPVSGGGETPGDKGVESVVVT